MIVELSDSDAHLFISFQKNYETFLTLEKAGVFDVRNGHVVLNFNATGTLCDIDCTVKTFKRGVTVFLAQ